MLSEKDFTIQSLVLNMYHLRKMKCNALSIAVNLPSKEKNTIDNALFYCQNFCELLEETVLISNYKIPKTILDSNLLVTSFSFECESLLERLFDVKSYKFITEKQMKLMPGVFKEDKDLVNKLKEINEKAYKYTKDFISYTRNVLQVSNYNSFFLYSYPTIIAKINTNAEKYLSELERLIKEENIPSNQEYIDDCYLGIGMKKNAILIRNCLDPRYSKLAEEAYLFAKEYEACDFNLIFDKEKQKDEIKKRLILTYRFRHFLKRLINGLMQNIYYMVAAPILLDTILREVNYYILLLERMLKEESIF